MVLARSAPIPAMGEIARLFDMRDTPRWLAGLPSAFDKHGDLLRIPLGLTTLYAMRDPDHFAEIFRSPAWDKRADLHKYHHMLMGSGLVTSRTTDEWQRRRKIVQPHYATGRLGEYVPIMQRVFDQCFSGWSGGGEPVDAHGTLRDATMRINLACLLHEDFETYVGRIHHVMDVLAEPQSVFDLALPLWVPTALKRTHVRILAELDAMVADVVQRRRKEGIDRGDYLSSLMSATPAGSDKAIRDEIVTLLVAGHETTASALAWTLYELAVRPDLQDRLATCAPPEGGWTPEALRTCVDATKVSNEGLRMYPPVMVFIPRQTSQDTELGGIPIAAGSFALMFPYLALRHPLRMSEPDSFDPDRPGEGGDLAFASGRRKCAGATFAMAEMNLFLTEICRRFRFSRAGTVSPRFVNGALMPANGVPLALERR